MNRVNKSFLGSAILAGTFTTVGIVLLIATRECSLFNVLPVLGGIYVGAATFFQYRKSQAMTVVEFRVRLESSNRGEKNLLTENYHFSGSHPNGNAIEIFIEGKPKLTDDKGKKLKEGYLYDLTYLTGNGEVEDYNSPFAVTLVNGIARKE